MLSVLVACEMSGRVRSQFAIRGWNAWSADLLPDETDQWNIRAGVENLGRHYQGDVLDIIEKNWDLVIAHPPCTDLCQGGARYWKQKQADGRQAAAANFFMKMYRKPPPRAYVVVENPAGIMSQVFREPDQVVEPWMFGTPLQKKTCLWYRPATLGSGWPPVQSQLPQLEATHSEFDYPEGVSRTVTGGGSWRTDKADGKKGMNKNWEDSQGRARRSILRSITPEGFARAAAEQWGSFVEAERSR
jgi:site-specific DNA-cytosine methylase